MPVSPPANRDGFDIAIICALPLEAECIQASFDKQWYQNYGKAIGDDNTYTTGLIAKHNVVLAHMPELGKVSAAIVAAGLRSSFKHIRLAFVVGICGAAPFGPRGEMEIILGDVVISETLVQYDLGKQYPNAFKAIANAEASFSKPGSESRSMLAKLKVTSNRVKLQDDILLHINLLQKQLPHAAYPGAETDKLYQSSYIHRHRANHPMCDACESIPQLFCARAADEGCDVVGCEPGQLVLRRRLAKDREGRDSITSIPTPKVHLGRIGSADTVMKSAERRDRLAEEFDLVAFEMEGSGVWNHFPNTLVLKGVCDYADSHKNKRWQHFAAATAASCLKALLHTWEFIDRVPNLEWHLSAEDRPRSDSLWHIPFVHRDLPTLIGRAEEIQAIESLLFGPHPSGRAALLGLGGMGKTRVAIEIAERQRTKRSVFWVQAKDIPSLESDYNAIAKLLKIPGLNTGDNDVRKLVPEYLDSHFDGEWIMILDNADDVDLWRRFGSSEESSNSLIECLPKGMKGSILITTRNRQVALTLARKHVVDLQELGLDQAKELLTDQLTNTRSLSDVASTQKLLAILTCLPLAIVQAASYINMNDMSIKTYLQLLSEPEDKVIALLSEDFNDEGRYKSQQNPIATTWLLSFKQIQDQNPSAAQYLAFTSCIGEKSIPQSILPTLSSTRNKEEALGVLKAYSFLRVQNDDDRSIRLFDMHRLVRLAMRNWLRTQNLLQTSIKEAITHVKHIFPADVVDNRELRSLFLPHAQILCDSPQSYAYSDRYSLLRKIARFLHHSGKREVAMALRAEVVKWSEDNLGKENERTMRAYADYSKSCLHQNDYKNTELYARTAFQWYEKTYGIGHNKTIISITPLSRSLSRSGRPQEAQQLCEAALNASERRAGSATSFSDRRACLKVDLSLALSMQGQIAESEDLLLDVIKQSEIEGSRRYFGVWFRGLKTLAKIYMTEKRYDAVEKLLLKSLEVREEMQSQDRDGYAWAMYCLAYVRMKQGRKEEAIEMITKCVDLRKKILTPDEPSLRNSIQLSEAIKAHQTGADFETCHFRMR
ncbi:hypothetical protein LTR84_001557 [Exophiala bonariae]|uniref:Nucleoside phosphorylase domain-containing protein n=1 Tax=Exophiala bonariae TaxID=1690606 RepID=A0AAV9NCX4_9EURO|nr:hypothetical protein LTR84_001557 [Exophiala bonariae]